MNAILLDSPGWENLLPLCFTRPVSELRTGILTIAEKWEKRLKGKFSWQTESYLQAKYPKVTATENLLINAHVCPTDELIAQVKKLQLGQGIVWNGQPIVALVDEAASDSFYENTAEIQWMDFSGELDLIQYPWDLTEFNSRQIQLDFDLLTADRESEPISHTNQLIHPEDIFVEQGAKLEFATINATAGPVYIGRDAEIMEGSFIRGPFVLGDHAVVNMGSKIYGATTIGPFSKVGGEISQSILIGYSNKGHDGFLGNSVLGEWCNLGAGTNVSNLKNNYEPVKMWNYTTGRFYKTGLQFGGLIMGDHSKAGISSMFNTGTVVGVGCNIHGTGFPRQFVPSFADGGPGGFKLHQLKSVFSVAEKVMTRRNRELTEIDKQILTTVFDRTSVFRSF
ncbi:GlmU family protein [uncultured Sunxiuqinia sp.]|uniref:GlmU family protein n=1 Tax=uncultured Sunxiuqinia sp. TaxID=1573825 RepID=UPI002AA85D0E|nr:GlmU family protein [uncultured Sunxiuqinia sp.]